MPAPQRTTHQAQRERRGLALQPWIAILLSIAAIALGSPNRLLHVYPAALVGLAPLLYLCWQKPFRQQLRYCTATWVGACTLVFLPDPFSVEALTRTEIVGGVIAAPLVPLYFITATLLSLQLTQQCGLWLRPLAIAAVWTSFDGLFGILQFPLPLHYGACLFDWLAAIQIADIASIWGVTFLAVLSNAAIVALWIAPPPQRWLAIAFPLGLWIAALTYGTVRLSILESEVADSYRIATLQPVAWLEADRSWTYRDRRYRELQDYSTAALAAGADLVAWPEGAMRAQVEDTDLEERVIDPLLVQLPEGGGLIVGASEPFPGQLGVPWDRLKFINSALLYGSDGSIRDRYGKQWLFQYFETARYVPSDGGYRPLQAGESLGQLGVSICLESVMPRASRELVRQGAQSLLTISDDSWFGKSNWPMLHSVLSVFRAIETRRSFAFVNNTGGNLVVAPSGRILARGPFWQREVISGAMSLRSEVTIASRSGDWLAWGCLGVTGLLGVLKVRSPHFPSG